MSGIAVTLDGLTQLIRQMERLPDDLEQRLAPHIRRAADETAAGLVASIASRTGTLAKRVTVVQVDALRARVESRAPHAWLHEYGSGDRYTRSGAYRGRMPAAKAMGRVASTARRRLNERLVREFEDVLREASQG
jgi:hypothetical protein